MASRPSLRSGSDVQSIIGHEAFFPGEYQQKFPNSDTPKLPQLPPVATDSIHQIEKIIPIKKLSHGTHHRQALQIQPNRHHPDEYVFKAQPRLSKEGERTFKYTDNSRSRRQRFELIDDDTDLLPGTYSWWGVSVEDWYHSESAGQQFRKVVLDLKSERIFVAEYLQTNPPECPYGDQVFTVDFKKLLDCYVNSRQDVTKKKKRTIKFRFAGTLRYLHEICYVIIISMVHDDGVLGEFDSIDNERHIFDHRGLTNANGEFKDNTVTPTFKVEHMVKCIPIKDYYSWETPAFAFYFPNDGKNYELRCPKDLVTKFRNVRHVCNNNCQRY